MYILGFVIDTENSQFFFLRAIFLLNVFYQLVMRYEIVWLIFGRTSRPCYRYVRGMWLPAGQNIK